MEELEALGPRPSISSSPVRHEHKRSEPDSQHCQRAEKSLPQNPGPSLQNPAHPRATHPFSRPAPALHARPNTTYGLDGAQFHLHPTAIPSRTWVPLPCIPTLPSHSSSPAQEGALSSSDAPSSGLAMLLQAPACCPGELGKAWGGCVGLEAGAGAGRSFHTTAQEGESTSGCVMKPHPAWSVLPISLHANVQETPSAVPALLFPTHIHQPGLPSSPLHPVFCFLNLHHHIQRCSPTALCRGLQDRASLSTFLSIIKVSLLFPSWQMPGCAMQHSAIQTAVLILAPAQ